MTRRIVCALAVAVLAPGCTATDDRAQGPPDRDRRSGFSGYGCPELARQVESSSRGDYQEVRQITDLEVVQDHRADPVQPRDQARAVVLRCVGSAQWQWGREPIVVEVTSDRDGQTWVSWEPALR